MTQLERLIARLVQLVEDNPGQIVVLTITVSKKGVPICWVVTQAQAEGLAEGEKEKG